MADLRELYQDLIVDHGRRPRNFTVLAHANYIKEGFNPLCGDQITLYVKEHNKVIEGASFQGKGCAICLASASLMTETIKGKTLTEVKQLFTAFHILVTEKNLQNENILGKLVVMSGVGEFPARVKCATLAWHTLIAAIDNNPETISTE